MRLQKWLLLLFVMVLAGCGGDDSSSSGTGPDPATAIPAGAPVYVEAVIRPEGEQGDNVRELLGRFLGEKSVTELLDEQLAEDDQTYAEDIEPWLGDRAGVGVLDLGNDEPTFVGALAITDAEKAEAALAETTKEAGSHSGVTLYEEDGTLNAVTDDFLLLSEDQAQLEAAIDGFGEESLADDQRFQDALGELPEERLAAFYLDTQAIGELVAADPSLDPAAAGLLQQFFDEGEPLVAALTAEPDAATIETRLGTEALSALGPIATGEAPELVADAPAGSWGVIGYKDVGETLKTTIATLAGGLGSAALSGQIESELGINLDRDVLSWIGDLSVFVRGDSLSSVDGAVVIAVSDAEAARAAIPRLVAASRKAFLPLKPIEIPGADRAFALGLPTVPKLLVLAEGGDRVVIAFGEEAAADALNPTETIADSGLYDRAQDAVDGIEPSAILEFATLLRFAAANGATDDPDYAEAKPYLDQLDLLATGAEQDGDDYRSLFTLKVK